MTEITKPKQLDAEATMREAILVAIASEEPTTVEGQVEEIYRAILAEPIRWALLSLIADGRVEFIQIEGGALEPRGYCELCRRLVGVTDRGGIGLADRAAYMDAKAKGLGCFLVPHDQEGTSARCPGGGKRVHS